MSHAEDIIRFNKDNWFAGNETFNIKVYAHIITTSSGDENYTEAEVISSIENLNKTFGPNITSEVIFGNNTNIQFFLDPCIDYIEKENVDFDIKINQKSDGLDIYYYPSIQGETWGGRGSFKESRLAVYGRFLMIKDRIALSKALAHEVGHVFGLYHTWQNTGNWLCIKETSGLDGIPENNCLLPMADEYFPEPVYLYDDTTSDLQIRSKTGDYIADTPADPFKNFDDFLPASYDCTPAPSTGIVGGQDQYPLCNRTTDCLDHYNRKYEYSFAENDMFQQNIMSYAHTNCLNVFSADQISFMRHNLREGLPHLKLLYEAMEDYSTITGYKKIDCSHTIDYDITIEAGGYLEVTETLYFAEGHGITLESGGELFLNGGTLTKVLCNDKLWEGVKSVNGAKITIYDGKIEYAITGIDHNHFQFFLPVSSIVFDLDDAEFAYCNTGIKTRAKFSALYLAPFNNLNVLNIHDCGIGFDAHRTERLKITNSNFDNNEEIGLKLSDESMTVQSSGFQNMPMAISYNNMGGSVNASTIGGDAVHNNVFYNNGQCIVANAPFTNDEFLVSYNTFLNNGIGSNIAGISESIISNNDFYGGWGGCGFSDGGGLDNSVKDNLFTFNLFGAGSVNDNLGLLYARNCFSDNYQGDIALSGFVNKEQGNLSLAASNTFSKITNVNTFKLDQAEDFDYFVKQSTPTSDARYPSGIDNLIEPSVEFEDNNCGSTINPFPVINFYRCQCSETYQAIVERIEELEQAINDLKSGNLAANPIYKRILIAKYSSCIEILEECIGKSKEYNEFEITPDGKDRKDEYDTRTYPLARVKTMNLLLSRGQFTDARIYLTTYSGEFDVFYSDKYEQLMNIYLNHIDSRSNALIHRQTLEIIAEENHVFKGYARSMLCYYYNDCKYDIYNFDGSNPRNSESLNQESFSIYPNPAATKITINSTKDQKISIISSKGILEIKMKISVGPQVIDISDLPKGVYFIQSYSSKDNSYYVQKMIKI